MSQLISHAFWCLRTLRNTREHVFLTVVIIIIFPHFGSCLFFKCPKREKTWSFSTSNKSTNILGCFSQTCTCMYVEVKDSLHSHSMTFQVFKGLLSLSIDLISMPNFPCPSHLRTSQQFLSQLLSWPWLHP